MMSKMNQRLAKILDTGVDDFERINPAAFRSNREHMWSLGVPDEQYNKLWWHQEGKCAICSQKCVTGKGLAIDHCHDTKRIRGLLCMRCNTALGNFKDSVDLLRNAIKYLESTGSLLSDDDCFLGGVDGKDG